MHERDILLAALEKARPEEREAYLSEICGADAQLRSRLDALLRAAEAQDSFLEHPAIETQVLDPETLAIRQNQAREELSLNFLHPTDDAEALGRLGPYTITEVIGRGGMGVVLKARDTKLNRIVALKVMAPELATNPMARKRFQREAHVAAAVVHQHIVTIHAVDEDRLPYLVMECIVGQSLQEKIDREGHLQLVEILRIGQQVASGLAAAHAHGLIHRDVKPANILLENGIERVRITDFGLARAGDDVGVTRTGEVAGTPQYMSPEQAQGLPMDARSDLFSLGCVLYAMCTGRPPFRAETAFATARRVCEDTPRPIREVNAEIPQWLTDIIERLLQKDPAQRLQSAEEVAELLGQYLAHVQQPAIVPLPARELLSFQRNPGVPGRQYPVTLVALLLVLASALGLSEAAGTTQVVPTVIRIVRGEGALAIEVADPTVQVSLDGKELHIRGAGLQEFRLLPGNHHLYATKDGQPIRDEIVTITRDGRKVVTITLEGPRGTASASVGAAAEESVEELALLAKLEGHTDIVRAVGFQPGGRMISVDGDLLRVWDLQTSSVLSAFPVKVTLADVSMDGRLVAGRLRDSSSVFAGVWDVEKGKLVCQFNPEWRPGDNCIRFTPDGTRLVTIGQRQRFATLWDAATGSELGRFDTGDTESVHRAAFSPENGVLAISVTGRVCLFDIESRNLLGNVQIGGSNVSELVFAASGKTLATGQNGGYITLIDVESRRVLKKLQGSNAQVRTLRFLGNDRFLITSSYDATLRLWDLQRERVVAQVKTDNGTTQEIYATPDGQRVIAAGGKEWDNGSRSIKDHRDYALRVWQLPESVWLKQENSASSTEERPTVSREPGSFVLLASGEERKFDTLAEAVQRASDSDTIEIRGNGPFISQPVKITGTPLTLRAGPGFRPVIRLDLKRTQAGDALLMTSGTLCVEGVELQTFGSPPQEAKPYWSVLLHPIGANARLFVTNCRFVSEQLEGMPIRAAQVALLDVRNSQFVSQSCLAYSPARNSRITLHHNLIAADPYGVNFPVFVPDAGEVTVDLTHNTLVAPNAVQLFLDFMPETVEESDKQANKAIRFRASGNLFLGIPSVLRFEQSSWFMEKHKALSAAEMETLLRAMVDWSGERNGFASNTQIVQFAALGKPLPSTQSTAVAQWDSFWGVGGSECIQGQIRFAGGDLLTKAKTTPELLSTEDYRLRADSAGYRAGNDGKDLGADVDLVGPGEAYERWKKTPEYHQWLKEIGQQR